MMDIMTICFLSTLLFVSHTYPLLTAKSQLLPIVDDEHGGGTGLIQTYIVHVLEPEGTQFLRAEDRENWHRSFLPNSTLDSGEPRLVYSYRDAISGFAARLTPEEAKAMLPMDGFLYARPEKELVVQTTYTYDFLGLNQWNGLWYNTSYGSGMIIGVIDSGITPSHPSFKEDGMPFPPRKWRGRCDLRPPTCNKKLIGATAFRAGSTPSPIDDSGHGTHTAGTAAGSVVYNAEVLGQARGTAAGMAPGAHLSTYKVLYSNRGQESDFLAGIDQAIYDGVDVLSMSLGLPSGEPIYQSSIAIASFTAITKGIVPSCCAMNEGPFPSVLSNDAPWCLTVGASTVDRRMTATVVLGNGMEIDGESSYQPSTFDSTAQLPIVFPGLNGPDDVASCKAGTLPPSLNGKIVVCLAGGDVSSTQKGENVKANGGAAMIVLNLQGLGFTTFADPHVLPTSHVSFVGAEKIVAYFLTTTYPTATIVLKGTMFGARPTPAVAAFSSRGPSLNNGGIIKPDIIAPGVNILAAWPNPTGTSTSTFNFQSGTSMATPHVSGIVAMLKKNHPQWSPAAIKSAIMTTAYSVDSEGDRITDQYNGTASFFVMGAGHVNPGKANDPGLVYDLRPVDYIPYLCGLYPRNADRLVTVIVRQRVDCWRFKKIGAEQLNYPSIAVTLGPASTIDVTRTATNVDDGTSRYTLQIAEPDGVSVVVDTSYLRFSSLNEERSFRVRLTSKHRISRRGEVSEGFLTWVSAHHVVRSPISVTFT